MSGLIFLGTGCELLHPRRCEIHSLAIYFEPDFSLILDESKRSEIFTFFSGVVVSLQNVCSHETAIAGMVPRPSVFPILHSCS